MNGFDFPRSAILYVLLGASCLLIACSDSGPDEIASWMTEQQASLKPKVVPIEEPKVFVPEPYDAGGLSEPFNHAKLTGSNLPGAPSNAGSALLEAELRRRKEPLEAFPLDSAAMVGVLKRGGATVALVKIDALLYQVAIGAYLGQNYGKVVKVSENSMILREIVQDGAGEWIERSTTLELQEGTR